LTKLAQFALLTVAFAVSTFSLTISAAQSLTGTVTNGTTNKPAAGDEVILINLTTRMEVAANTKADSNGKFSFQLTGGAGPHLIRAVHQGVTYHQIAPPGTTSVDVTVYDVTTKVSELSLTADVIRFQADAGTMQGVRLFVVNNASAPGKTQMNDHNFEFYLPAGAKVEQVQARAPNGQPVAAEAVAPSPGPASTGGTVATESAAVETASAEIEFVTSAIEDLQSRLERANTQMNQVTAVRATEREIGLLFVEAQKFTEAALAKLEGQIHQILDQAEAKAAQIVREAQEEAEEVRRQAESASVFPAEKAQELQAAIRGFSSINGELVKELSALNTMLSPPNERGIHAAPSTNGTGNPS